MSVWGVGLLGIRNVGFESSFFSYVVCTGECLKLFGFTFFLCPVVKECLLLEVAVSDVRQLSSMGRFLSHDTK